MDSKKLDDLTISLVVTTSMCLASYLEKDYVSAKSLGAILQVLSYQVALLSNMVLSRYEDSALSVKFFTLFECSRANRLQFHRELAARKSLFSSWFSFKSYSSGDEEDMDLIRTKVIDFYSKAVRAYYNADKEEMPDYDPALIETYLAKPYQDSSESDREILKETREPGIYPALSKYRKEMCSVLVKCRLFSAHLRQDDFNQAILAFPNAIKGIVSLNWSLIDEKTIFPHFCTSIFSYCPPSRWEMSNFLSLNDSKSDDYIYESSLLKTVKEISLFRYFNNPQPLTINPSISEFSILVLICEEFLYLWMFLDLYQSFPLFANKEELTEEQKMFLASYRSKVSDMKSYRDLCLLLDKCTSMFRRGIGYEPILKSQTGCPLLSRARRE